MQKGVPIEALVLIETVINVLNPAFAANSSGAIPTYARRSESVATDPVSPSTRTLSGVTTKSIVTRRLPHHKRLNVSMLTISVSWFTKSELERNLFPRISVQVEPERVEPFWMKRIRSR